MSPTKGEGWIDRLLVATFPTLLLEPTPWLHEWTEKERSENVVIWRIVFPLISLIYVGHLLFFDQAMNLQPYELWITFRLSIAAIACATFLFYCVPALYESRLYRVPVFATCWLLCYTQAQTAVWYDESQYLYAFIFVVVSTLLIRTGLVNSLAFAASTIASQWSALASTEVSAAVLYSGTIATITFVLVSRSGYRNEVRYFLATQQNAEAQRKLIELNIEFTDRFRAFLPREISHRLTHRLNDSNTTVLQAIDDILRPEERTVSCLFSDIRGFTKRSKASMSFLSEGVLPSVKKATTIIEQNSGVQRKIGDLVFAYFDSPNPYVNLVRCIQSGISLVEANQRLNERNAPIHAVKRYVLIASGRAIVGNIGGLDSSIEITALGPPVNLLSRLDELTKQTALQEKVNEGDLIVCAYSASLLVRLGLSCEMSELPLLELGLKVRDFEEVASVWLVPANEANRETFYNASHFLDRENDLHRSVERN